MHAVRKVAFLCKSSIFIHVQQFSQTNLVSLSLFVFELEASSFIFMCARVHFEPREEYYVKLPKSMIV